MANKYRNEFKGTINGHEIKLRPTFNALVEIEDALKMSIPEIQVAAFQNKLTIAKCMVILEICADAAEQPLDKAQLIEDIETVGLDPVGVIVVEFLKTALFGSDLLKKN